MFNSIVELLDLLKTIPSGYRYPMGYTSINDMNIHINIPSSGIKEPLILMSLTDLSESSVQSLWLL